jgi:hypothetical protein
MAIYSLEQLRQTAPPEFSNASDEELIVAYSQNTGQNPHEVAEFFGVKSGKGGGAFGTGISAGVDQTQAMLVGAGAAAADLVGADGVRDRLNAEVRDQQAQAVLSNNPEIAQRIEDIGSVGEFGQYFINQLGQQVPIMGGIVAAGAVTGGVGGVATGIGARAGLAGLAWRGAAGAVRGLGSTPAGLGAGYTYGVGSLYNESVEGGNPDAAGSFLGAVPYAAAESLVPLSVAKVVKKSGGPVNLLSSPTRRGRAAQGAAAGLVGETGTELLQSELEMGMRDDLTPEEIASRRLNAAVSGGLIGGTLGAGGGFLSANQNADTDTDTETKPITNESGETDLAPDGAAMSRAEKAERRAASARQRVIRAEERAARTAERKRVQAQVAELEVQSQAALGASARKRLKTNLKRAQADLNKLEEQAKPPEITKRTPARKAKVLQTAYEKRMATLQPKLEDARARVSELESRVEAESQGRVAKRTLEQWNRTGELNLPENRDLPQTVPVTEAPVEEAPVEQVAEALPARAPVATVEQPAPAAEQVEAVDPVQDIDADSLPYVPVTPVQGQQPESDVATDPDTDDDLVTPEQIIADQQAAEQEVSKLNAEVKSDTGSAKGNRSSIGAPLLATLVRHLRNPRNNKGNTKLVYLPKTATIDQDATQANSEFLDNAWAAYSRVVEAAASFYNKAPNLIPKEGKDDTKDFADYSPEAIDALLENESTEADLGARDSLGKELAAALENFETVVGGRGNVEAFNAVFKRVKEKKASSNENAQKFSLAGGKLRKRKGSIKSQMDYDTVLDTLFSSSWAAYRNGELQDLPDLAPKSRPIRANRKEKKQEDKSGLDIAEKDLRDAYNNGYGANNNSKARAGNTGIVGVINRAADSGTANVTSRLLAKMLRRYFKTVPAAQQPKLEFGDETSFDPTKGKGGTITLLKESTPEEVLHEVLHAALQGMVYREYGKQSQSGRAIAVLEGQLDNLLAVDLDKVKGLNKKELEQAKAVVAVLRKVAKTSKKDAILELISYGNTFRDFKLLLTNLPKIRNAETSKWRAAVQGIWEIIRRMMNYVTGVTGQQANDLIDASVQLLNDATKQKQSTKKPVQGAKLMRSREAANSNTTPDVTAYAKEGVYGVTEPVFKMFAGMLPENTGAELKKLTKAIRDAVLSVPMAEKMTRWLNPYLSFGRKAKEAFDVYKKEKHTPVLLAELVSRELRDMIETNPENAIAYINYLDTKDVTHLEGLKGKDRLKDIADNLLDEFAVMVEALDSKSQAFFKDRKFSDALIFVEKGTDVGSNTIGLRKLSQVLGKKTKTEENLETDWVFRKGDTTLDTDADYFQVFFTDENGNIDYNRESNFIRADVLDREAGKGEGYFEADGTAFHADRSVAFKVTPNKDGKFTFVSNLNAKDVIKLLNTKKAADKIGFALLNTANTLSSFYSSRRFFSNLKAIGRDKDGDIKDDINGPPVWFKTLEDVNNYFSSNVEEGGTYRPLEEKFEDGTVRIHVANSNDMKNGKIRGDLRVSGSWVKIPDTAQLKDAGLPIPVWGELAGGYMPGPVFSAILDMGNRENVLSSNVGQSYNSFLRQFKLMKTTRNPGTHITNIASNMTLMMMHGIQFKTVAKAGEIIYKAHFSPEKLSASDRRLLKEFEKSGALLGNFSATEVKRQRIKDIRDAAKKNAKQEQSGKPQNGLMGQIAGLLDMESAKMKALSKHGESAWDKILKGDQAMLEFYAAEDNIFRLASFMTRAGQLQREAGTTELSQAQWDEAGKSGRTDFLNYDIDAIALQYARQTLMPFASWTYAVIPVLGKIAVTKPWMIANVITSYAILDSLMSAMAGDDEEMRKNIGDMYNERIFGFGPHSMIRIPFMGDDENPVYWRIGDYIPLASTVRGIPAGTLGYDWWPQAIAPTGPLVSIFGMFLSVDPYTGKKVDSPTDSNTDVTMRNIGTLYDMMTPPAIARRNIDRLGDYMDGAQSPTGRDISPLFIARAFGAKFYTPNVDDEAFWGRIERSRLERDYGAAIATVRRETLQRAAPDYEEFDAETRRLKDELDEKIRELEEK